MSYWRQVLAFAQSTKPSNSVIVFTKSRRAGEVFLQYAPFTPNPHQRPMSSFGFAAAAALGRGVAYEQTTSNAGGRVQ